MVDVDYHLNIKLADISAKKNEVEEENQTNTNYNLGKINFCKNLITKRFCSRKKCEKNLEC